MTEIIKVEGMGCQNCVNAIETSVGEMTGVTSVKVNLEQAEVTVELEQKDLLPKVKETIEEQGYDIAG